jgi:hypothetical protein
MLCSKGVVKWMTKLIFDRYSDFDKYRNGSKYRSKSAGMNVSILGNSCPLPPGHFTNG